MKCLYHATDRKNLFNILSEGLKKGCDGHIYLTDSAESALKFVMFRGCKEFAVFKINVHKLDASLLSESFDHDENFFKCKAWQYADSISYNAIMAVNEYKISRE